MINLFRVCALSAASALGVLFLASAPQAADNPCHQHYPNIEGRVLLENDEVVVQHFVFPPGVWEGVHTHPSNQVFIHIRGGQWTERYGENVSTGIWETGTVGWQEPVGLEADHDSMNSGLEPIELIWVTLKDGCVE